MSCIGNGYLSGNMLVAFPFEDDQCLAWPAERRLELQQALQRCFVDAFVSVSSHSLPDGRMPSLGMFTIDGSSVGFDVLVGDSSVRLSISPSGEPFPVLSGSAPWGSYVVVVSSEGLRDFASLCNELSIAPPVQAPTSSNGPDGACYLRLCAKCVEVAPVGLTSLMVYDGVNPKDDGPHFVLKGDVKLKPGNNMQYLEPDDEENAIEIAATPGAGLGRVACVCEETVGGNAGLAGSDGHARLFNDTCYDIEPLQKYVDDDGHETQVIKLHAKCTACCTCDMYASIVNDRLAPMAEIVRKAMSDISALHSSYESAVKKFNERISKPSLSDITLTLSGMPIGSKVSPNLKTANVTGNMSRCSFTAMVRNSSFFPVNVRIATMFGSDSVVEATAAWSTESGDPRSKTSDSAAGIMGADYVIQPGRSLSVTFISEKGQMVSKVSTGGFSGKFAVDVSYSSGGSSRSLGRLRKDISV